MNLITIQFHYAISKEKIIQVCAMQYPMIAGASPVAQLVKNPPAMQETWVRSLVWEDPLKKGKATHSSILDWRILWTIQSMGLQRAGNDWATFTFNLSLEIFLDYCFGDYFLMWHIPKCSCDGSDFGIVQIFSWILKFGLLKWTLEVMRWILHFTC